MRRATQLGVILGTAACMAPEQAKRKKVLDPSLAESLGRERFLREIRLAALEKDAAAVGFGLIAKKAAEARQLSPAR
jgi:hypothetical protein